jgi:acetyltransferase EpsM
MNDAIKVAIVGGKGNGLVVAQIVEDLAGSGREIEVVGFLNDHEPIGSLIGKYPVLGRPGSWTELDADVQLVFALLSVGKMHERSELLAKLQVPESRLATLIHPTALISYDVSVGSGSVVASYVTCQPSSSIGNNSIVRAGANLGHDSKVGDFVDIGPNCTVCGYSSVERGAHVAPNSVVRDSVSVGEFSVLSAGSVALKDIGPGTTWMGNPARRVR